MLNPQMMPQNSNPGMFAQMAAQQQGGQPPAPMMGPPPSPPGQPNMPPMPQGAGMPPPGPQSQPPQGIAPNIQHILQQLAQQGRGGDTMIAHLTPGEMEVPPEVQTPKVLATLKKAYKEKGVQPQQFTAGSPASSINPTTGLPEYNFMSAFLPAALGIAGSIAAPYLAPELLGAGVMGGTTAAAVGGGLGTTVGGLAAGQSPTQAALSGLGSGIGGYALGNLGSGLTAGGNVPGQAGMNAAQEQAILSAKDPAASMAVAQQMGLQPSGGAAGSLGANSASNLAANNVSQGFGSLANPTLSNGYGMLPQGSINPMRTAGSALGGYIGGQLGATPKPAQPNYPPGFNTPMDPVGSKGSAQQQLGQATSVQPMPSFNGFNPATNYPAAYNFYPSAT